MEVLGRDPSLGVYRVRSGDLTARVPETLMASEPLVGGQGHGAAYAWIARNAARLEKIMNTLADGGRVKAPFDTIVLEKD